jgi:hypothetical protein
MLSSARQECSERADLLNHVIVVIFELFKNQLKMRALHGS